MTKKSFLILITTLLLIASISVSSASRINITLTCTQSPSSCNDDCQLLCDLPMNIKSDQQTQVKNVKIDGKIQSYESKSKSIKILEEYMTETIPEKIGIFVHKIENFEITNSRLEMIKRADFTGMGYLKKLNLESNKISIIPHDVFHNITALEVLLLNDNQIRHLQVDTLSRLPNLREFNIEFNQIEGLETGTFKFNPNLREIYLNNNIFGSIRENFVDKLSLEVVDVSRNSEYCTKCAIMDKKQRQEKINECHRDHFDHEKVSKEEFEKCVNKKTSEREDLATIFFSCKNTKENIKKSNSDTFEICKKKVLAEGFNLDGFKMMDECIVTLIQEESQMMINYEACVNDKSSRSEALRSLISNCTDGRAKNGTIATDLFNSCKFCEAMNSEENVKKCGLKFVKDHYDSIEAFQANVDKYFNVK